jgi:pyruvate dehydrogenase E2 component (dihydrolipoamide acetyltransferase)
MAEKKLLVPNIGDFKNVEVIEVLVKSGQQIKKNDPLITLESDKSSVEVPATDEGKINKIIVKVGDKVSEGSEILSLDSVSKKEESKKTVEVKENIPEKKIVTETPKEIAPVVKKLSKDGVSSASPKVRKFARELGADIVQIPGSQRAGRVTEDDVKKFVRSQVSVNEGKIEKKVYKDEYPHEAFGEVEKKDLPRVKKLSGPQLVRSWTEIPHVTQHDEIDITEMEQFRTNLIDNYTGERIRISPLAFITRAVIKALKKYPNFNSSIDTKNNKLIYKKYFHIGFAVDTPHGLMVPKIRNADNLGLKEIFEELKRVSKLCKELKIEKKEFFGGSITISSLGGIGGNFFTPIINPPEVAILGVGKTFEKIRKVDGQFIARKMLPVSLSYDHRVIDGAEGARFCVHLAESLGKDFAFKLAV